MSDDIRGNCEVTRNLKLQKSLEQNIGNWKWKSRRWYYRSIV